MGTYRAEKLFNGKNIRNILKACLFAMLFVILCAFFFVAFSK